MKKNLKDKLKSARLECGLTQKRVAKNIGMSPSTVGMYEQGRREPDCYTLINICDVLNISILDILYDDKVFYVDSILKTTVKFLEDIKKTIILNGKILDNKKRSDIAHKIKSILNGK